MSIPIKYRNRKLIKSVTLVELIISVTVVSVVILSFYSINIFGHNQVINSQRRTKIQNELSYALEHMGRFVQQANGSRSDPGIEILPAPAQGFRVRVDFNQFPARQTPGDSSDDAWVSYTLVGSTLRVSCARIIPGGTCGSFVAEDLSNRIRPGFTTTTPFPNSIPLNSGWGFYVQTFPFPSDPLAGINIVEVGLIGRFANPGGVITQADLRSNPQSGMKARLICNSCSTN